MPKYILEIEVVTELIMSRYPSFRKAAAALGISHSYLSKVLSGKREPGRKFIDGILADFKGVKFEEIFKEIKD
ncbi:MAG: helix-turn-helix domain-containing protein [Bacillota bacterium]